MSGWGAGRVAPETRPDQRDHLQLDASAALDDLLDEVPSYVPGDIAGQVELAEADHALGWLTRQPVDKRICAPAFSGSNDLDGADAVFITEGHLIDRKATIRPDRFGSRKEVHQLADYLLLDYEDEYSLDKVGFYLSRQGQPITWSMQEFLGCWAPGAPCLSCAAP